jgi:phage protein D
VASLVEGDAELAFEDDRVLRLGAAIEVYAGDVSAPREIFRGTITALEAEFSNQGPPELVAHAEDALQLARMARRTRVHEHATLRKLGEDLARALGLTPVVTGFDADIGTQVQLNESDLAFVRRLLRAYDGDLQVVGKELHVSPRSDVDRGEVTLELFSQLSKARIMADLAHQRTEVTVSGWDAGRGERVSATSRGAKLGPGTGRTGAAILEEALGKRSEHLGQVSVTNDDEAQAFADALFDQAARRFLCVRGTTQGNPSLRVGSRLRLGNVSPRFDNVYYVVGACHRYDVERGYETDFEAECAYLGSP